MAGVLGTIERMEETGAADRAQLAALLGSDASAAEQLFEAADRVRAAVVGEEVHLRALIEFSNHCRRNCRYCGLRRDRRDLPRYRMAPDEIVLTCGRAADLGYRTVVLQSGEDPWYAAPVLASIVRQIKESCDAAVTLSIGERSEQEYRLLRSAGADRFLLRLETSGLELYEEVHPDSDWHERLTCLRSLRASGFQVGSGVLIGLPGQTFEMLAQDLLFLQELNLDMVGVGPFIPHPDTPLARAEAGGIDLVLRFVACLRLLCPRALIPATSALSALAPDGWERGLAAGADVLMPNVTPARYRELYQLYPGRPSDVEDAASARARVEAMVRGLGRRVSEGPGHSRLPRAAAALAV
jgi:biotin synthase